GLRLEFTCNDLQPRDYVVFLNPAAEEPAATQTAPAAQAAPAPIAKPRPTQQQMSAVRPRRPKPTPKTEQPRREEQPKAEVAEKPAFESTYLLRPDYAIDLQRSTGVTETQRESLRNMTLANVGIEEATAQANRKARNLEAEVSALRKD